MSDTAKAGARGSWWQLRLLDERVVLYPLSFLGVVIFALLATSRVGGVEMIYSEDMYWRSPLIFLAVLCAGCSLRWEVRVFRIVHIAIGVILVALPTLLLAMMLSLLLIGGPMIGLLTLFLAFFAFLGGELTEGLMELARTLPRFWLPLFGLSLLTVISWIMATRVIFLGYRQGADEPIRSLKRYYTTLILLLGGGLFGMHLFYLGRYWKGALFLFTLGGLLVGVFRDLWKFSKGELRDGRGQAVRAPEVPPPIRQPVQRAAKSEAAAEEKWLRSFVFSNLLFGLFGTAYYLDLGWPIWAAIPVGLLTGLLALLLLVVVTSCFRKDGRQGLWNLLYLTALRWKVVDQMMLRHATGRQGQWSERDGIAIWSDGSLEDETRWRAATEEALAAFRQLLGDENFVAKKPLRIIILQEQSALWRYSEPLGLGAQPVLGYYLRFGHPRIVVTSEWDTLPGRGMVDTLVHEYAHFLHLSHFPSPKENWLIEAVALLVQQKARAGQGAWSVPWRNYLWEKGGHWTGEDLISNRDQLLSGSRDKQHTRSPERLCRETLFYWQSELLGRWLEAHHREALREEIRAPLRDGSPATRFTQRFGLAPNEAMAAAGEQILADDQARKKPCPAEELNRALEAKIYPVLEDPQQSPAYRELVLRLFLACAPSVEEARVARWEPAGDDAWKQLVAMVREVARFDEERTKKLSLLQSEIQIGLEQLHAGRVKKMDDSLIEGIKERGRKRLNG